MSGKHFVGKIDPCVGLFSREAEESSFTGVEQAMVHNWKKDEIPCLIHSQPQSSIKVCCGCWLGQIQPLHFSVRLMKAIRASCSGRRLNQLPPVYICISSGSFTNRGAVKSMEMYQLTDNDTKGCGKSGRGEGVAQGNATKCSYVG